MRPYAGERWWVAALFVGVAAVFAAVGYALAGRRDVGAGLLPERPGPAEAAPGLRSPLALAWRLHRGLLLGWVVGLALTGAVMGGAAAGIGNLKSPNQQLTDILTRMGGRNGLTDAFLAAIFGITGMVAAAYTVQATLRLRQEESSGRVEALLATRVGRLRWAASHLVVRAAGHGAAAGRVGRRRRSRVRRTGPRRRRADRAAVGAALVQLPAAWVLAGLGTALIGLAPRLSSLTWAALILSVLLVELGALFGLNQWIVDLTPFAHVPKLPGSAFTVAPVLWLTAVAVALGAAGSRGCAEGTCQWRDHAGITGAMPPQHPCHRCRPAGCGTAWVMAFERIRRRPGRRPNHSPRTARRPAGGGAGGCGCCSWSSPAAGTGGDRAARAAAVFRTKLFTALTGARYGWVVLAVLLQAGSIAAFAGQQQTRSRLSASASAAAASSPSPWPGPPSRSRRRPAPRSPPVTRSGNTQRAGAPRRSGRSPPSCPVWPRSAVSPSSTSVAVRCCSGMAPRRR